MKIALIILSSLTVLMMLSTLICGLWTHYHGADPSSVAFHLKLGVGSVIITVITIIVMFINIYKS